MKCKWCVEFNIITSNWLISLEFEERSGIENGGLQTVVAIPSETPFRRADPGSRGQVIGSTAVASIPRYGVDTRADCHRPPRRRGQTHLVAGSRVDTRLRRHLTPSTFPRVLAPRRPIPTPSPKVPTKASACNSLLNSPPLYVPTADAVINCRPLRSSWSPPPPPNAGPGATSWRITIKCFARIKSFVLRWED